MADLELLLAFTMAEAKEAEGIVGDEARVREGIRTALGDSSVARYWVLETDSSELVGHMSVVKEWSDWNSGYYWWIQSMYIRPAFRGRALMDRLLHVVEDAARQAGALELRLYVHAQNERAIKAYRKAGFSDSEYRIMTMSIRRTRGSNK
ncbi:MAG: GNAT family N-acetyltransferase [Anaerolineales bacterium]|nr:MAG: GNAT family N-acetyltransferase [Anaerolineales bacterium]